MSLANDVAIAAAERVERTGGASAGLAIWRRLASSTLDPDLRGRAILGGLRCAIAVRDLGAMGDLTRLWQTVDVGMWDGVYATCKAMWRADLGLAAIDLAQMEVRRLRTARALYAYARCLDVAGDPRAAAAFADAIARAENEGATELARASRIRRLSWLARAPETLPEAIEEAKHIPPAEVGLEERLELARALLRSPSRFVRAGAIGLLDDVAKLEGPLHRRALRLAARHADLMGDALTPLEVDRLGALFSRVPSRADAERLSRRLHAIDGLAQARAKGTDDALATALATAAADDAELALLHRRAHEILVGRVEPLGDSAPSTNVWTSMLDVVAAMRAGAGECARAASTLRTLVERVERNERVPPQLYTIAQFALAAEDDELRAVAGRLVASMSKTETGVPPRGWLGLSRALAACGMEELAMTARRSAALAKEPGALEALTLALTTSGWRLAQAGERRRAISMLREARALAGSAASTPSK